MPSTGLQIATVGDRALVEIFLLWLKMFSNSMNNFRQQNLGIHCTVYFSPDLIFDPK